MRNTLKFSLVCGCMAAAGIVIAGIGYAMGGRVWEIGVGENGLILNSPNLSDQQISYIQHTEELESFTDMDVSIEYGDLLIEPSDHFGISYNLSSNIILSVEVKDGCLKVTERYQKHYGYANFTFHMSGNTGGFSQYEYVKIQIPTDAAFDKVSLKNNSGDIKGSNFTANTLVINNDYGNVSFETIESAQTDITLESCKVDLNDFSGEKLTISNNYGNAALQNITMEDIVLTMESVAIDLSEITASTLKLENDYGKIIGKTVSAPSCTLSIESVDCSFTGLDTNNAEIQSEYGNVNLGITKAVSDYTLKLTTEYGSVNINNENMGTIYKSLDTKENSIVINCESGNISLWEEG